MRHCHSTTALCLPPVLAITMSMAVSITSGAVTIATQHLTGSEADAAFAFTNVPVPSKNDVASSARFAIVDGEADRNSGGIATLHDGRVPADEDEPAANFFFAAGTTGGRVTLDMGRSIEIREVNTYSWHPTTRGSQVYKLYGSQGGDFDAQPAKGIDPETCGWKRIANVDTRSDNSEDGGQYGVSISDSDEVIGRFQYLLFDISQTETNDAFGNTFYSEIDVVDKNGADPDPVAAVSPALVLSSADGACQITIDSTGAPELSDWAEQELAPVVSEWYPKIVAILKSDGFTPPDHFSVTIRPGNGVAATGGTRITANSNWLKRELDGEAVGAIVHEVVHVAQQYRGRRRNPDAKRPPGWLVEGIPDYIRWFLYEPNSHGADIVWLRSRRNVTLNHDAGYRITANFLDYVVEHYDTQKTLITRVNAACRQGGYTDDLWKKWTGKSLTELNDEWKAAVQEQLAANPESP